MSKKRNRTTEQNTGVSGGRILTGGIAGIICTLILTFLASVSVSNEWISLAACQWLGQVILAVSAFFACLIATGNNGKKLISGLLCAGLYAALLLIVGLLLFSQPMRGSKLLFSAAALLFGTIGGILLSGFRN